MNEAKPQYADLGALVRGASAIFQPPERLNVSDAAQRYVTLHNPPAYIGPYKNDKTPYMREPMDAYASRHHTGMIFVSSAQSAKTQGLILNTTAYTVKCNPADIIIYTPSQAATRDFSRRRIDRMHRHSKELGAELMPGRHSDNTFDKFYKSGMMLTLSWPSVNEMAGKPVPICMLTDYDRMPLDVDGEGSPFDLAQKRNTTFKSFGMTVAESSPSYDILDPKWKPETPHQAPPCEGILALYNRGDRRRWYWPCPECGEFFEGSFSMLKWEDKGDPEESARTCYMVCPRNGCYIKPDRRNSMNARGRWLKEGQTIDVHGEIHGAGRTSATASFWLKGVAAAFTTWPNLVAKYLNAEQDYRANGTQEALKVTVNTDQGEPYLPRGLESDRVAEDLQSCARGLPEKAVPEDVRTLIATCDVQKNRWEVQVHGIRPGKPYDIVVIDRFQIVKSNRVDPDGERLWVKPAEHPEDWDLLITEVMEKRYPLATGEGTMGIGMTLCDSGGREGVTSNAYAFYVRLKKQGRHERFMLIKGDPSPNAPRAAISFPDSQRKDRMAKARGEVPVLMLNPNVLKDTLNGMLPSVEYTADGIVRTGRIEFPDWLPESWFEELTAEIRTPKGWENKLKKRNESWDLLYYCIGCCVHRRIEHVLWDAPPAWLLPWDRNPHVQFTPKAGSVAAPAKTNYVRANLGAALG